MRLDPDPMVQLRAWLEDGRRVGLVEPDAMALATVGRNGHPGLRMVLLRGVEDDALLFFTDYESGKGQDIAADPRCTLLFYWGPLVRQVRVEGRAERAPAEVSDAYFAQRPRGSRISAVVSRQSRPVASREDLEREHTRLSRELGEDVPRPERWGGYRVIPSAFEFWQGREDRLHDRIRYERTDSGWRTFRLSP